MLKRNDLAKKFEQVVQQEVINHNKSILETNKAINSLRKKIEEIETFSHDLQEANKHTFNCFSSELESVEEEAKLRTILSEKKNNDKIDELLNYISRVHENTDELKIRLNEYVLEIGQQISDLKSFSKDIKLKADEIDKITTQKIFEHKKEIKLQIDKLKYDLTNERYKNIDLEERISSYLSEKLVDISGNKQELESQKKKQFILEKTCEHLLTQINRLKGE